MPNSTEWRKAKVSLTVCKSREEFCRLMEELSDPFLQKGCCHCGCGEKTRLAPRTQKDRGWVKGEPIKYIKGHWRKSFDSKDVIAAYEKTGNVHKAGKLLGCSGDTVAKYLREAGVPRKVERLLTSFEKKRIQEYYAQNPTNIDLTQLATELNRSKSYISRWAREMGLTNLKRPATAEAKQKMSQAQKDSYKDREHPRGMLGRKHSQATKSYLSAVHKKRTEAYTPEMWEQRWKKSLATRQANNTPWPNNPGGGSYAHVKRGFREDIGIFVRSGWEANWARYLNYLVDNSHDKLYKWEYEPDTFWFKGIRRGVVSYTPDFKLYEKGTEPYYQEVKGRMDSKSKTKLKRMAKYHPDIRVELIDEKAYKEVARKLGPVIPEWE